MRPDLQIKHIEKNIAANELWLTKTKWKHVLFQGLFFGLFMTIIMYAADCVGSEAQFNLLLLFKNFLLYFLAGIVSMLSMRLLTIVLIKRGKKKVARLSDNL